MTHTVFIDLDSHVATASATGTAAPDVPLKHLTKQTLAFAFHSGGTVSAVTGWSAGRVVIKTTPTSDVLLLDTTLAATGSTTSTRYSAEWAAVDCDSAALRTLIGASVEALDVFAEIQWTADSGTHAVAFPIQIVPTFNLPEDDPPDPTEAASWTWLKARLAAGSNITFTDNDTTQVRTIAASGGGGGGGGSTDWGDIGGTLSDQTDLQTALNNKQPLAAALTTLASSTAAGLALMDDADAAAQRTTLGLGNASTLNVGTTAGTVAAGDDSRLSDARTPTAHAASHVTGGSDAIQSATASQNGLATAAQIAKLDSLSGYTTVSSSTTLVSNTRYIVEAGSSFTLTLPASPIADDWIELRQGATTWAASPLTIDRNGKNINGAASNIEFYSPGFARSGLASWFLRFSSDNWIFGPQNIIPGYINPSTGTALTINPASTGGVIVRGGALGTPASGVLTNCTGLPVAGLASFVGLPVSIQLACSDEGTALTTGTAKLTFRMPHAMTLTAVRASVGTAPTGSTLVVDINEGGTSILGTKLSIDATEKTSTTAASAATITDSALADDAEITIDIDQIGSTIAGAGLKVTLIGTRA